MPLPCASPSLYKNEFDKCICPAAGFRRAVHARVDAVRAREGDDGAIGSGLDGKTIDQGIAYFLMLVALLVTYLVH
ncbi:Arabinogalactan peptide 16 [Platanthera guangdongensis]|uniref:Arabinogalactan peptide 16 n=1 Tax=Platanthera guangdongensis TaxID=2320717 RepID=A0ABR2M1U7_9ASPA